MTLSWKLGKVAGIDLYVHPTFLLLLAVLGLGDGGWLAVALVGAAFGCVLLHELGHALAARWCGIQTLDITLYPIGGVARLERMPRKPGVELLITAAGPLVNLGLAGMFHVASVALAFTPGNGFSAAFLGSLAWINLVLAAFNLIPAFPMDGGRLLRALLTGRLGRVRATEIAAGLGKVLAVAFGFYSLLGGHVVQALLAVFVYVAATAELMRVRAEEDDRGEGGGERGGVWVAPAGYRWVRVGHDAWQLAPIRLDRTGSVSQWR